MYTPTTLCLVNNALESMKKTITQCMLQVKTISFREEMRSSSCSIDYMLSFEYEHRVPFRLFLSICHLSPLFYMARSIVPSK